MQKFTNLKVTKVDIQKSMVMVDTLTNPVQSFRLMFDEFMQTLTLTKYENGIIYGDFELVELRKKPTLLFTNGDRYYSTLIANKVKEIKKPLKELEVGKIYHSKNSNEAGNHIYLYLGKNYYSQIGYGSKEYIQYKENPTLEYGDCFLEFHNYGTNISICGNIPMALEATPEEIKPFNGNINHGKELLNTIFIFGTKEYVESKMVEGVLKSNN